MTSDKNETKLNTHIHIQHTVYYKMNTCRRQAAARPPWVLSVIGASLGGLIKPQGRGALRGPEV